MSYKNDITVVIPTYNRYDKLLRLLQYYKAFGFPYTIRILDSGLDKTKSPELTAIIQDPNITCQSFDSSIFLTDKISEGLAHVTTPYVVLNADDDFLVPGAVNACVDFLKQNADYSLCEGIHISYKIQNDPAGVSFGQLYSQMKSIENANASDRVNSYLPYYYPIFYGVYKTTLLQANFKSTKTETDDLRFFEILPAMLTACAGKIKILDRLFIALEESAASTGATTETFLDFKRKKTFGYKYKKFKDCIVEAIRKNENSTYEHAAAAVDKAMRKYLILGVPSFLFSFRRVKLFILNRTPLVNKLYSIYKTKYRKEFSAPLGYDQADNPDYEAFSFIKQTVKESLTRG